MCRAFVKTRYQNRAMPALFQARAGPATNSFTRRGDADMEKPKQGLWGLRNISFGFFGIQIVATLLRLIRNQPVESPMLPSRPVVRKSSGD
jgi:hypothetical protein